MSQSKVQLVGNVSTGATFSGIITATGFVGNVTGTATGLSGTPNLNVGVVTVTYKNLNPHQFLYKDYILECCGPKMISKILDSSVKFLPKETFNPQVKQQFNWGTNDEVKYQSALEDFKNLTKEEKNVFTRHFLTGNWG